MQILSEGGKIFAFKGAFNRCPHKPLFRVFRLSVKMPEVVLQREFQNEGFN